MAPKKNKRSDYSGLVPQGVDGDYQHLVDQAIRNQWTRSEFERHLLASKVFQRQYPGLVDKDGSINSSLSSSNDVNGAVARYGQLADQYKKVASNYPGVKLNRQTLGVLIANDTSVDEFAARAQAVTTLKQNPLLHDYFNEALGAAGQKKLDQFGMLRALAGMADAKVYDAYEAAQFRASGLNLNAQEANQLSRNVGTPGQQVNTGQLISQVKAQLGDIGPELDKQHISLSDLAISLSQQGLDAAGIGNHIKQLIDQRRAQGTRVAGIQAQRGAGGGVQLYEDQGAASGV